MDPVVKTEEEPAISLFHSKLVYLWLEREKKSIVYIGSHNWTGRALGPGSPRNAEASLRLEFEFSPEHLEGVGNSAPAEVNRHLLDAWNAAACLPATSDSVPAFQQWVQKVCKRASDSPLKEITIILAVCKTPPQASDWLALDNAGIYMQALEEDEGRQVYDSTETLLLVWESPSSLAAGQQPYILKSRRTASNAGPNSALAGNNLASSPMEGFKAIVFDEAQLAAMQQSRRATSPPITLWSGRDTCIFDFEFPTTRNQSAQVDGIAEPLYQIYLQTEAVVFPANARTPLRARYAWERETFAVAESKVAARLEEAPGYFAPPELRDRILHFLGEVLQVDPAETRVLPYSERGAKVGKRLSRHPLQDTYIGSDFRAAPVQFYEKSTHGMLVPDIDPPTEPRERVRHAALFEHPLPRVQGVFTMPLKDLLALWSNTAQQLLSGGSSDHR